MNSKELKARLEELGFGIVHTRTCRNGLIRAYVAARHPEHPKVDELWYTPGWPSVLCIQHAVKPNGYTQYDKVLYRLWIAEKSEK